MTRVLLTGATGRLGSAFLSLWSSRGDFSVIALSRDDADLSKPEQLEDILHSYDFEVLVNPAAMSGLEECLDKPDDANAINAQSPEVMAKVCSEKNARFIHFSTDYVFSGEEPDRKSESGGTAPVNEYGKTKLLGEQKILDQYPGALIARVSWLFGPTPADRPCHFDQVLERAISGDPQQYIHDKYSMPTFTHDVVRWTEALLKNKESQGVYHLCNTGEPESWHSSAEKLCLLAVEQGALIKRPGISALSITDAHFFREKRPVHTAMFPTRLVDEGIAHPRHWLDAATDYLKIR
ncbi:MAG: NAD(P)-dependent oxidoreductase [Akkermansiaceae bacterium]